ncbi:CZB domain-containing protein [Gynuella sp.]|uniref:CZB domain-containing protein n=1 Tax=Gynuella sp. TaxID=2969146 RepID=UPI003D0B0A28
MLELINRTNHESFIQSVILDHFVWKNKVYTSFMEANDHLTEEQICAHNHQECRLGKWYYDQEKSQKYSHLKAFQELEGPHIQFHEIASDTIRLCLKGDIYQALEKLADMEETSEQVFILLVELLQQMEQVLSQNVSLSTDQSIDDILF